MIEIENMQSTVSDEVLNLVASFCGHEVKDKLLYEDVGHDGILGNLARHAVRRVNMEQRRGGYTGGAADMGEPKKKTRTGRAASQDRSLDYPVFTPLCPKWKQKFSTYSREKRLFVVASMGVMSCRWCQEVHELNELLEGPYEIE